MLLHHSPVDGSAWDEPVLFGLGLRIFYTVALHKQQHNQSALHVLLGQLGLLLVAGGKTPLN